MHWALAGWHWALCRVARRVNSSQPQRIPVANSFVSPAGLISSFSSFLYYLFSCQPAMSFLIFSKLLFLLFIAQAAELCFQKAFTAKLIYNISWISSATNAKRNLFSTRGGILCVREVRYDPNSILDLFWPEVSSTLFSTIETLLAEPRYRPD